MVFELDPVRKIVERVAASSGLEVLDVEMLGGGKSRMLRIVIDKPAAGTGNTLVGVTHEDCANLSREVSTILDVEDVVPGGTYVLEVSSPGLDRKLVRAADFQRFVGSRIKLTTKDAVNGNRHFMGRLENFNNGRLTIELDNERRRSKKSEPVQKLEIELSNVEKANLVPEI